VGAGSTGGGGLAVSAVAPPLGTAPQGIESARPGAREAATRPARERPLVRLAMFSALALYGIGRWGTLMRGPPTWRLLGLWGLCVALAGGVPLVRRLHRVAGAVFAAVIVLAAFPVCGVPWRWFVHLRVSAAAEQIHAGMTRLPNTLVPYLGHSHDVRLVLLLGAAVWALDAAAVMAFAAPDLGDARRAAAALPLIALAVVPSTLVHPQFPYLQGLLLFALVAGQMWGERIRLKRLPAAVAIAAALGVAGALIAPRIDQHRPWVDYQGWAGSSRVVALDSFDWDQSYGPLHWPQTGHEVLAISAGHGDYWKTEDLDTFDGVGWRRSGSVVDAPVPAATPAQAARWGQTIGVTVEAMSTTDIVAAGDAQAPEGLDAEVVEGTDPGTWVSQRPLTQGTTYDVSTYSPRPSPAQLNAAGSRYPGSGLSADLTLALPVSRLSPRVPPQIRFAPFGSGRPAAVVNEKVGDGAGALLAASPYAGVDALAGRLRAHARTPYAFVAAVARYLRRHERYDQNPPLTRYPLVTFLFGNHLGYCQQFSGAMAMLLRMGGVPARVAAGFLPGTYDAVSRQWIVNDLDAHAWVEIWFPHYGWWRIDPTPLTAAQARQASTVAPAVSGSSTAAAPAIPARRHAATGAGGRAIPGAGGSGVPAWALVAAALVLAGLLALAFRAAPRPRIPSSPDDLVDDLERALRRAGRPVSPGTTLATLERQWSASPAAAGYIRALRLARYGGRPVTPSPGQRRAVRRELRRGVRGDS
jgi:transglutaminase-like putative cysteine protease